MKPDLILMHGALGNESHFDKLKEQLKDYFNVHSFSFSGHGTDSIESEFSIELFESDLRNFYSKNKIDKAFLFGYSMGGYVALRFAIHNPEKVRRIFTYGTKFNWNPESSRTEAAMLNPEKIEEKVPKFAEGLSKLFGENWKNVTRKTAYMMLDLGDNPRLNKDNLKLIGVPVKIAIGTKDHMVSMEESMEASESINNSNLEVFENGPHLLGLIDQQDLAKRLKTYFI